MKMKRRKLFVYHKFNNRTSTVTDTVDSLTNTSNGSKHRLLQQNNSSEDWQGMKMKKKSYI